MLNEADENIISYCAHLVYRKNPTPRLDIEDFLQEGRATALEIKPKFDETMGAWSTYLRSCVYNRLCKLANDNVSDLTIPTQAAQKHLKNKENHPDLFQGVRLEDVMQRILCATNSHFLQDCLEILTTDEYNAIVGNVINKKDKEYKNTRKRAVRKLKKYVQETYPTS